MFADYDISVTFLVTKEKGYSKKGADFQKIQSKQSSSPFPSFF